MGRGLRMVRNYVFSSILVILTFISVFALSYHLTKKTYSFSDTRTNTVPATKQEEIKPTESIPTKIIESNELNEEPDFVINVYNGTKYSGLAANAGITLRSKGYKVGEIANADRRDYSLTIIKYKTSVGLEHANDIQKILEDQGYVVAEPEEDGSIKSDIAIYLGKV